MKGRDRNKLCWCGSQKKQKKCHGNREHEEPVDPWKVDNQHRKLYDTKTCLHPEATASVCSGKIVRAHTVRRSADLKSIARDGHVYQMYVDRNVLNKTGGKAIVKLIGINNASTFWGFCSAHDASTFSALENAPFIPTDEQALLVAYRPLAKELYLKQRQLESNTLVRDTDKGRPEATQRVIQQFLNWHQQGIQKAIEELTRYKTKFDNELVAKDFSHIKYVVFHFDTVPDIVSSGVLQPRYTFDGKLIQDLADLDLDLDLVAFSIMATDSAGAAVFAWRDDSGNAATTLVDSLLSLPHDSLPDALLRYSLSELENTFIAPDWWESLEESVRATLIARLSHNLGPTNVVSPRYLVDDGMRAAAWKVTKIDQHR